MAAALLVVGAVQAAAQFVLDASLPKNPYGGTYNLTTGPPLPFRTGPYTYSNGSYSFGPASGGTVTLQGGVT